MASSHDKTALKITSFARLKDGWSYGRGQRISQPSVVLAKRILGAGRVIGFSMSDAFPGLDGEVMVTFYQDRHCVETVIELGAPVILNHEDERGNELSTHVCESFADIEKTLRKIYRKICQHSSVYSMERILIGSVNDSSTLPSSPPAQIEEFQFSTQNAPVSLRVVSVGTSRDTTQPYPVAHRYTGSSTQANYPMTPQKSSQRLVVLETTATGT